MFRHGHHWMNGHPWGGPIEWGACDAFFSAEHIVFGSIVHWAYLGIDEVDHAVYQAYDKGYFWQHIYGYFCLRDITPALCGG